MRLVAKELLEIKEGSSICLGYKLLVQASKKQFREVFKEGFNGVLLGEAQACSELASNKSIVAG